MLYLIKIIKNAFFVCWSRGRWDGLIIRLLTLFLLIPMGAQDVGR
jgi:hypothetical protein